MWQRFSLLTATPKPDWADLWWLVLGIGIALIVVVSAAWRARSQHRAAQPIHWLTAPLQGLDSGWSFSTSWAANLTAVGALVSGLFASSDVLKSILGASPDQALAVTTVAGIIAVGLAGAGTLLTATFTSEGSPLTIGVLAAAAVTLGGAIGQLLVIGIEMQQFAISTVVWILVAAGAALFCLYGLFSIYRMITESDIDPIPAEPSDTLIGASAIVLALRQDGTEEDASSVYNYARALQKHEGVATYAARALALRSQAVNLIKGPAPTSLQLSAKDPRLATYFSGPGFGSLDSPLDNAGQFTSDAENLEPYRSARRRRSAML